MPKNTPDNQKSENISRNKETSPFRPVLPLPDKQSSTIRRSRETQPQNLPQKLLGIRLYFNFTQIEMVHYVLPKAKNPTAARAALSEWEKGRRTPSLLKLYNYAVTVRLLTRYKKFNMEDLVRDDRNLPWLEDVPAAPEEMTFDDENV